MELIKGSDKSYNEQDNVKQPPSGSRALAIAKIFASLLGVQADTISADDNFFLIGGNSILAMKAGATIWKELHISSPMPPAVVLQYPSISSLEQFLDSTPGIVTSKEHIIAAIEPLERFLYTLTVTPHCSLEDGGAILLTGATGFFGGFLLAALLRYSTATIYCLVRGVAGRQDVALRGQELLASLPVNAHKRVRVLPGDVSLANFGMKSATYSRFQQIPFSHVIHNAAKVHWLANFDALFSQNVEATASVLNFAASVNLFFFYL